LQEAESDDWGLGEVFICVGNFTGDCVKHYELRVGHGHQNRVRYPSHRCDFELALWDLLLKHFQEFVNWAARRDAVQDVTLIKELFTGRHF
jgi:hypothetical protein